MQIILDRHEALGTVWWVEADVSKELGSKLAGLIASHLGNFEGRYSRFKVDSLVSQLNGARELTDPDPDLLAIMSYGQSLYKRTGGHFNFLVGDILTARGYGQGRADTDAADTILPNPLVDLTISPEIITLRRGSVDLGGFGKGYVIDELAEILASHSVQHFLINGGGDLYGTTEMDGSPIKVHLEHPTKEGLFIGATNLSYRGFAASSPYKRIWKKNGHEHNHIVGTTTATTFVLSSRASDADAFATACLLATEEEIVTYYSRESLGIARFFKDTGDFIAHNFPFLPL